jgi:hypothetical protein
MSLARTVAAGVTALIVAAALALAPRAHAAIATYSGLTSPQDFTNDGVDNGRAEPSGFNLDGTGVYNVVASTSLRCPDGSYMNLSTRPGAELGEPFPVTGGHFDATIGNPNDGFGVTWHLVGDIANGKASGTAEVQAHEFSGVAPTGPVCTSSFTWTASTSASPPTDPTTPTPPVLKLAPRGTPRPAASLFVIGLRSPDRHFYWGTEQVRCLNGATNLIFTVRRSHRLVSRRRLGCRRGISLASSRVRPHRSYAISVQAIRMRRGRVVTRGETYRTRLYMPGNEANWTPVPAPV